jgi:hypothetical protein
MCGCAGLKPVLLRKGLMNFEDYLDGLVPKLRISKRNVSAEVFYDLMSGALVWTDEKITGLTAEEMGCLRAIFRFRTSIIAREPYERFRNLWNKLRAAYPDWIGFDPSRCQADEDLSKLYHQRKTSSKKYLDRIP